jgi:hypothetical protein
MPDTWVTPRVWTAGERVGASKMNEISNDFRSLFPFTTGGDLAYRDPAGAYLARLAIGAAGEQLFSTGSILAWGSGERYIPVSLNADVALTVGDNKGWFGIPAGLNGWNISSVFAWRASGGTGVPEFQIRNITDGVDVLSTKLSIDSGEVFSGTAATPAVIDATKDDVATGDQFAVDADVSGTNTFYSQIYVGLKRP